MKNSELIELIGKKITFSSNRTWGEFVSGSIEEVTQYETHINGDWHDNKTIKIKTKEHNDE